MSCAILGKLVTVLVFRKMGMIIDMSHGVVCVRTTDKSLNSYTFLVAVTKIEHIQITSVETWLQLCFIPSWSSFYPEVPGLLSKAWEARMVFIRRDLVQSSLVPFHAVAVKSITESQVLWCNWHEARCGYPFEPHKVSKWSVLWWDHIILKSLPGQDTKALYDRHQATLSLISG
jgi:hypothetical protein